MSSSRRVLVGAAVIVAILLAVLGSVTGTPWQADQPAPDPRTPAPQVEAPTVEPPVQQQEESDAGAVPEGWVQLALAVLLAVAAGLLLRALLRHRPRRSPQAPPAAPVTPDRAVTADAEPATPDLPPLRRGVAEARRLLAQHRDPGDAVVAAWLAVEEAAAASGVPRQPAQTPSEFAAQVLSATPADPGDVRTLLRLYHRARYATGRRMGPEDVATAEACLQSLAARWAP